MTCSSITGLFAGQRRARYISAIMVEPPQAESRIATPKTKASPRHNSPSINSQSTIGLPERVINIGKRPLNSPLQKSGRRRPAREPTFVLGGGKSQPKQFIKKRPEKNPAESDAKERPNFFSLHVF